MNQHTRHLAVVGRTKARDRHMVRLCAWGGGHPMTEADAKELAAHPEAERSHGLCPAHREEFFPDPAA